MEHFWGTVSASVLVGILLSMLGFYMALVYVEQKAFAALRRDFAHWLRRDFVLAQRMPWPVTPSFEESDFDASVALWLLKALGESYAMRYDPHYQPSVPDFEDKPQRFEAGGELVGFGTVSGNGTRGLLVFHGTSDLIDVFEDAEALQVPFGQSPTARVYQGMYGTFRELLPSFVSWQQKHPGIQQLVMTGHSSGGVLAILLGASLAEVDSDTPLLLYTFGAPKVGNRAFQRRINQQWPSLRHYRVLNSADVIPTLPLGTDANPYWPSGVPILTYHETGNTALNHGLGTYARAVADAASHSS